MVFKRHILWQKLSIYLKFKNTYCTNKGLSLKLQNVSLMYKWINCLKFAAMEAMIGTQYFVQLRNF